MTKISARTPLEALVAIFVTIAVGWLWTGGQRALGHDAFHYLEYAKTFSVEWPRYFGTSWPFGYPLLGGLLARTGIPVYAAMLCVSYVSYFLLYLLFLVAADKQSIDCYSSRCALFALACSPAVAGLGAGIMSEPLFMASVFAFALSTALWPNLWALWSSGLAALFAFGTRYVGIVLFGVTALAVLCHWRTFSPRVRATALVAFVVSSGIGAVLCLTNYLQFGAVTGPHPVGSESWSSWPFHFAEFGWSFVAFFSSGQILPRLGGSGAVLPFAIGTAISLGAILLCVTACRHPLARPLPAAFGATSAAYILTLVSMRSTTVFDNLYNSRSCAPVVFALMVVLLDLVGRRRFVIPVAIFSICLSLALAWRGMSAEVSPDVSGPRAYLAGVLSPTDEVAVNPGGKAIAAYFPNRFINNLVGRGAEFEWQPERTRFTAVIYLNRIGARNRGDEDKWRAALASAQSRGLVRQLAAGQDWVVVERTEMGQR